MTAAVLQDVPSSMRIAFTKMHGLGNDFIVFDAPQPMLSAAQLRRLASRHAGIGFDQALVLERARRSSASVFYRVFNADGTEVEQCGNGARCIAALLHRRHGVRPPELLELESPAGVVRARIHSAVEVSVEMGVPCFEPRALPFDAEVESSVYVLEVGGDALEIGAVSIGNPHAVLAVACVEEAPVSRLGPALESHPRFPKRVNVGFMERIDRAHIRLRVFERGVGETLACGTGACAAVAIGRERGLLDAEVHVSVRGGELRVDWAGRGEPMWLTGPAEVSFEGHVDL